MKLLLVVMLSLFGSMAMAQGSYVDQVLQSATYVPETNSSLSLSKVEVGDFLKTFSEGALAWYKNEMSKYPQSYPIYPSRDYTSLFLMLALWILLIKELRRRE